MIRAIAFDLDDTLLNTFECILPIAMAESCQAMVATGLNTSVDKAVEFRKSLHKFSAKNEIHKALVAEFGVRAGSDSQTIIDAGNSAFYKREVKEELKLYPSALEILEALFKKYPLYLVTAGDAETQQQKIAKLQIKKYFHDILISDPFKFENKKSSFEWISKQHDFQREAFLSIGNRLDTDIRLAKEIGWSTCWVRQGEHSESGPELLIDKPDYEILAIRDVIQVCQL